MRKKLLFLSAAIAMCMMPLSSCSKDDEPRGPEANLKSVDGTEWVNAKAKIKFSNGKYTIDCRVPGSGTYTQSGNRVTFNGNLIILSGGGVKPTQGVISKYGDNMKVTFVTSSGDVSETLDFTYNILAN